jgi:hypothetical protein
LEAEKPIVEAVKKKDWLFAGMGLKETPVPA